MSDFEYVVGFYALLLGLAVANVALSFADMWRDRARKEIGYCAPLLAGIVLLGSMNVWLSTWATRQQITVDAWQMLAALGISLPYVFISRAMSPPDDSQVSLEDHYLKSRLLILLVLTVPPVISVAAKIRLDNFHYLGWEEAWMEARIAMPLALLLFSGRTAQRLGLGALNILLVAGLFR